MQEKIQKIIANAGITSRRKAEELIKEGRVTIDGEKVTKLGSRADATQDKIKVDGKLLTGNKKKIYIILNKPRRYITTLDDPQKRPSVAELLKKVKGRVFPVGRLDYDAEGLLLLTNDGALAHRLLHPRFEVPRTYLVKVKGVPGAEALKSLRTGVRLSDGMTFPAKVRFLEKSKKNSWIIITVTEGKNKLIKRMCDAVGYPVLKLKRTKFGPFSLGQLKPGEYRTIPPEEMEKLIIRNG